MSSDSSSEEYIYKYDPADEQAIDMVIAVLERGGPEMRWAELIRLLEPLFETPGAFESLTGAFRRRIELGEFEWIPNKPLWFRRVEFVRRPQKPASEAPVIN